MSYLFEKLTLFVLIFACFLTKSAKSQSVTVPITLDHNRMIVEGEILRNDGSSRKVKLWVDSGNPSFLMSEELAKYMEIKIPETDESSIMIEPPQGISIGGMKLNFEGVKSKVILQPKWMFDYTQADATLPSSVLQKYHIVFDYPKMQFTIAGQGSIEPQGSASIASINPKTGIVQISAVISGDSISLALDNGASFSYISEKVINRLLKSNPYWSHITGAVGCANMWGWWPPNEETFNLLRIPEMDWGKIQLKYTGIAGWPDDVFSGKSLGEWYSQKTASTVDGFLRVNAFKSFRVEIDYKNSRVYLLKEADFDSCDMDIAGISVKMEEDGSYIVSGIAKKEGKPFLEGIELGDKIIKIDSFETTGATMGKVVDALRGKPGEVRMLHLERDGKRIQVEARVEHLM